MSSGVRTSQMPNFSFHRSSTPMPYSFGKPALNCCGGSLSTLGNMKRPVAASAAADAAENAPQASPIQARRVSSGDVSSAARAWPPPRPARWLRPSPPRRPATRPSSSCRPDPDRRRRRTRRRRLDAVRPPAAPAAALGTSGLSPSAIRTSQLGRIRRRRPVTSSPIAIHQLSDRLQRLERRLPDLHAAILLAQRRDRSRSVSSFSAAAARRPLIITSAIGS